MTRQTSQPPHVRSMITWPPDWVEAFKTAAKAEKMSLSEWISEAGLAQLSKRQQRRLSPRRAIGRPGGGTAKFIGDIETR